MSRRTRQDRCNGRFLVKCGALLAHLEAVNRGVFQAHPGRFLGAPHIVFQARPHRFSGVRALHQHLVKPPFFSRFQTLNVLT
jgi:hypothetical protein